jgi:hypothetical protein
MRRFHNPRYAPESLERKLNPSSVVAVPVAAQVHILAERAAAPVHLAPVVIAAPSAPLAGSTVAGPIAHAPAHLAGPGHLVGVPVIPHGGRSALITPADDPTDPSTTVTPTGLNAASPPPPSDGSTPADPSSPTPGSPTIPPDPSNPS